LEIDCQKFRQSQLAKRRSASPLSETDHVKRWSSGRQFGSGPTIDDATNLLTYSTETFGVAANLVTMDGYTSAGQFDMAATERGLPFTGTLSLNGGLTDIDPSLFAA
jgi:hypothetical protein